MLYVGSSLVSDSFPGVGALKGPFFHFLSSSLKTSLPLGSPGRVNPVQKIFVQYVVCTYLSSRYRGTKTKEIGGGRGSRCLPYCIFLSEQTGGYVS